MAKTCMKYREMRRKYPTRVRNRCRLCGTTTWLYPPVRDVPYLFSRAGP